MIMPNTSTLPTIIIFDVFGTLVKIGERRSPYRKMMRWLRENGRKPQPNDAATIMSVNVIDFSEIAELFGKSIPDVLLQELNTDLEVELKSMVLYEDTLSTLDELKHAGFKIGLCSNLAAPYGQVVDLMLPKLDVYAWSYAVGAIKPDTHIYQYLLDQLSCNAKDILFIGDTPLADVDGPIQFGMSARLIDRKCGQTLMDIITGI